MSEAAARAGKWITLAGLAAALLSRLSVNMVDLDIWHEMALAREFFTSGRFPYADVFAYTPTVAGVVHHEWGAGAVAYLLSGWFGAPGILALNYALLAGVMFFCLRSSVRAGGPVENWAWLAVPALMLLSQGLLLPVRAQGYSFLFIAWLLWNLHRDEAGSRAWIAPWLIAYPVWANLHGGCVLGIVFTGGYWLEQVLRRKPHRHLIGVIAGMSALLALNPYGLAYYSFLWHSLTMPRPRITEWAPLWSSVSPPLFAFVICAALAAYGVAAGGRRLLPGISIVLAAAAAALLHRKMMGIFAVAWLSFVPGWLRATGLGEWLAARVPRNRHVMAAVWLVLIVTLGQSAVADRFWELRVPGSRANPAAFDPVYPVGAVEYLARHRFEGNLMTPFGYGAYVSWKLHPRVRVGMDGRYEVAYPHAVFERVLDFYDARPGWQDTLAAYPTDAVLVPLDTRLAKAIAWPRVYRDAEYALHARPGLALAPEVRSGRVPDGTIP